MTCACRIRVRYVATLLLALSVIILAVMIPGGPTEKRSFANYPTTILTLFNIFLTVLGLGSLVLIRYVWRGGRIAAGLSLVCGLAYLAVYALDLGKIFPVSADAMPALMCILEITGSVVAIPLIVTSAMAMSDKGVATEPSASGRKRVAVWLVPLVLVGIAIVVIATINAALKH